MVVFAPSVRYDTKLGGRPENIQLVVGKAMFVVVLEQPECGLLHRVISSMHACDIGQMPFEKKSAWIPRLVIKPAIHVVDENPASA
jgi:hypothetical protein